MIINVTDEYRIESDFRSWGIAKREKNGKWRQFSWCRTLPSVIEHMAELLVRTDPLVTDSLVEALERAREITEIVTNITAKDTATKGQKRLKGLGIG